MRRRLGYRRIHDLLRLELAGVNHKRVVRPYRHANLPVRKRKKAKRPASERVPLQLGRAVNDVWSMDFVSDSLANGRRIKCLTVADDFSHECVQIAIDFGMSGEYVTRLLGEAARFRGYPSTVRTDKGPEFTSRAFMAWAQAHSVRRILIEPGRRVHTAAYILTMHDTNRCRFWPEFAGGGFPPRRAFTGQVDPQALPPVDAHGKLLAADITPRPSSSSPHIVPSLDQLMMPESVWPRRSSCTGTMADAGKRF